MRNVTGALVSLVQSGFYEIHVDWLVERATSPTTSVLQSYSSFGGTNWIGPWSFSGNIDQPTVSGSLSLFRESGGLSLSPLLVGSILNQDGSASYSPALDMWREIECRIAVCPRGSSPNAYNPALDTWGPGDWMTVFQGLTGRIEMESNPIKVHFRGRLAYALDTQILDAFPVGSDEGEGTPVEVVMQEIADREVPGRYIITPDPGAPGFNIRRGNVEPQLVYEAWQGLVQQFAWRLEERWSHIAKEFRPTLYQPDRDATVPLYSIGPSQYIDKTELNIEPQGLRTLVRGVATDKDSGLRITSQLPAPEDVPTDPLILKYGKLAMQLAESRASAIDTQAELDDYVAAAYADVSVPPISHSLELFCVPWVELGDYVRLLQNGVHYDQDQDVAIIGWTHSSNGPGRVRTSLRFSGKPKGAYLGWQRVGAELAGFNARETSDPALLDIYSFGEVVGSRTARQVTIGGTCGAAVDTVWVYDVSLPLPITSEPRAALYASAPIIKQLAGSGSADFSYVVNVPPRGQKRFVLCVPRGTDLTPGKPQFWTQDAVDQPPSIRLVSQAQGSTTAFADISIEPSDPQGRGGFVRVWTNKSSPNHADPTLVPDVLYLAAPVRLFSTNQFDNGTYPLDEIAVHAGRGKKVYAEYINDEGVSSGPQVFDLQGYGTVVDPGDGLAAGVIDSLDLFGTDFRPIQYLAALPATADGPANPWVVLTTDPLRRLYRWNTATSTYTTAATGSDLAIASVAADRISVANLAALAIDTGVLSAGLQQNAVSSPTAAIRLSAGYAIPGTVTRHLDLAASGTAEFLKHPKLSLKANGDATFGGTLTVGGGAALNSSPNVNTLEAWSLSGTPATIQTITDGVAGNTSLRGGPTASTAIDIRSVPVDAAKTYRLRGWARRSSDSNGRFTLGLVLRAADGTQIAGDNASYWITAAMAVAVPTTFTEYTITFGAGTARPFPSNARTMALGVVLNHLAATTGWTEVQDPRLEEVIGPSSSFAIGYSPLAGSQVQRATAAPTTRADGSALRAGDVWINTTSGQGDRPSTWNGSAWVGTDTVITPGRISTTTLSAIVADLGQINSGLMQNDASTPTAAIRLASAYTLPGTATRYLDLAASGGGAFLKHDLLELTGAGGGKFSGELSLKIGGAGKVTFRDGSDVQFGELYSFSDGGLPSIGIDLSTENMLTIYRVDTNQKGAFQNGRLEINGDNTGLPALEVYGQFVKLGQNEFNANSGLAVGETALMLVHNNGSGTFAKRVSAGAANSGGAGFRMLVIPN